MNTRTLLLTALAMLAFAGNSLLCRLALHDQQMDAASFTLIRLASGALVLLLCLRLNRRQPVQGNWRSALLLFVYAAAFSFAYLELGTGTGALLLFGSVQISMLLAGWRRGERPDRWQGTGLLLALAGLLLLLLPSAGAPTLSGALLMALAGLAWAVYSLRGRGNEAPLAATAGNFLRALVPALLLALVSAPDLHWTPGSLVWASLSGGLASGIGYAVWYQALPGLRAFQAASVQLSVPLLATLGGSWLLAEPLTLRLLLASAAVLGGIALSLAARRRRI